MNEQLPQQPETPEEDLFEWGEKHTEPKPKPEKDNLGWNCAQCELNGGWCSRHPRPTQNFVNDVEQAHYLSDEDLESSARIADFEIERERLNLEAQTEENRKLNPQELDAFFKEMNKKLGS